MPGWSIPCRESELKYSMEEHNTNNWWSLIALENIAGSRIWETFAHHNARKPMRYASSYFWTSESNHFGSLDTLNGVSAVRYWRR